MTTRLVIERERPELLAQDAPGQHVWLCTVLYRVYPAKRRATAMRTMPVLLSEQAIANAVVGCWLCNEPWTTQAAAAPCAGNPGGRHDRA